MDTVNIQTKLDQIRSLQTDRILHFQYSKKAKIPFKVHSFLEIMNCRILDFCEGTDLLIRNNHIIPSLSLIRSLIENIATTYRAVTSIETSLESNKLNENFDELITKLIFGTRYEGETVAINIMTQIDKLDKEYNGIRKAYDSLSEFVHPNWDGVGGSYSDLNENEGFTTISKVITTEHPIYKLIETGFLLCMGIYLEFSHKITAYLPEFSSLCESEINQK